MAVTKEQLVQAYMELENLYAKLQQAQANAIADFNSRTSNIQHDFVVAKAKLEAENRNSHKRMRNLLRRMRSWLKR